MARIPQNTVKHLLTTKQTSHDSALIFELLEYKDRKFKIFFDIHNGSTRASSTLHILVPSGEWLFQTNAAQLNVQLMHYVSVGNNIDNVKPAYNRFLNACIEYIKLLY